MEYKEFLKTKQKRVISSGFDIDESELNPMLFDFQKFTVMRALKAGKYAIFANTGLGKTYMQLDIGYQISKYTNLPILLLAPLAVSAQTIEKGKEINRNITKYNFINDNLMQIINYDQIDNIDFSKFGCIMLDESSILKNETGKYRNKLIEYCKDIPYKFCFSATPSPNDPMELGNHAEFLDVMTYNEMLAMYFVHDSQETQKWRLKGHAVDKFYEFVSTWAIMYSHPKEIGFNQDGFDLPELKIIERQVKTKVPDGHLFGGLAVNATDYHRSLRETETERINETLTILKSIPENESVIIWTKQNDEAKRLHKYIIGLGYTSRNVQGSDNSEKKEKDLLGFPKGEFRILITKTEIASQGLNYQHCGYQIFNSVDFSFEKTYQGTRRSWRFGRIKKVIAYMITTDRMINVVKTQKEKQKQFNEMQEQMTKAVLKNLNNEITIYSNIHKDIKTDNYWLMNGDCVQRVKEIESNSIDLIVFSPPFADLYTYSNHIEDMGNVQNYDEFATQFKFLVKELKRVIQPGRIIAVHCMDLPTLKGKHGYIGINRFSSKLADMFENEDMFLHSEFTIWKDPLLAAVRTKTIGLAHKQLLKDSSIIRSGLPDKVLCFKTKEDNAIPIKHELLDNYIPMHEYDKFPRNPKGFNEYWGYDSNSKYDRLTQYSHHVWQRYASPVWMDISQTNVLKYMNAKGENDEKHICPLQLDVIKRIIMLYSNKNETILSPFGGIGSEGYQAIKMDRKSISIELKESYFAINKRNHIAAKENKSQLKLF